MVLYIHQGNLSTAAEETSQNSHNIAISQSEYFAIWQSCNLTILQYRDLAILRAYNNAIVQPRNLAASQFSGLRAPLRLESYAEFRKIYSQCLEQSTQARSNKTNNK